MNKINRGALYVFGCLIISLTLNQNCTGLTGFKVKGPESQDLRSLAPFSISRQTAKILPLSVRLMKMQNLLGSSDPSAFAVINNNRTQFGGYDHANGAAIDLSWNESRITAWAKAVQPFCQSGALKVRFPYPSQAGAFIQTAYGRTLLAEDNQVLAQVAGLSAADSAKFEVLCTVIVSSLEFNVL